MIGLGDGDRAQILSSFNGVGTSKAVGYLPLSTIESVLQIDVNILTKKYSGSGLSVSVLTQDECCTKSGAMYVYDISTLQAILDSSSDVLAKNGWPIDADRFVRRMAKSWLRQTDPVYAIIQRVFGEGS
jgi:hypothetical protein